MKIFSPRWRAALRYLKRADAFWKWRVSWAKCPNCGGRYFLSLRADPFMTRCLGCRSNATNLSLIPVIEAHAARHPVEACWEMSTYGSTLNYLKRHFRQVFESEYFPDAAPGETVDGVMNQDVQNLSFADESLDLITSNQVFEHVPDDIRGFRECHRVLRYGGALVFSVPFPDVPATEKLADIVDGRVVHFTEPEYHDSRAAGPKSVLTFWHFSTNDICDRLSRAGFQAELVDVVIAPAQKKPTHIVYAIKRSQP